MSALLPIERTSSDIAGYFDGDTILVPLLTPTVPAVTDQLRVAATLARPVDTSLHVINPVTVPEQTPGAYRHALADADEQELLDWAIEQVSASTTQVEGGLLYTRKLISGLLTTIESADVDTLVVPSDSDSGLLRRGVTERLSMRAGCDVVTVNGRSGYEPAPSILLPVAGGPHSGVATDVATRIATDCDAWIDVLHVVPEDVSPRRRENAEAYVAAAYNRIARPEATTTWILKATDPVAAIVEQSSYYELTIIGAPTKGHLRRFITGSTNRSIRDDAQSVVLSARNNR